MTEQFYELLHEADRILENDTVHEMIVLVKTAKGNIYHTFQDSATSYDPMRDIKFMDMLMTKNDTQVKYLVVLWKPRAETVKLLDTGHPYYPEMPGWCLRRGLLELAPENKDTLLLLSAGEIFNTRTLGSVQPLQTQEQKDREWKRLCALRGIEP